MIYRLPLSGYKYRTKTDSIVIHCAMTPPGMDIGAAEIRGWHVNENKWADIGYHFVIRRDGSFELGRPFYAQGAGVAGWNADSVHICLVGGCDRQKREENNFTDAQWRTLRSLCLTISTIDPGEEIVIGHRDYPGVQKYCPSFDVKPWWAGVLKEIRK